MYILHWSSAESLGWTRNSQFLEMVHENLQTNVICEDWCSGLLQERFVILEVRHSWNPNYFKHLRDKHKKGVYLAPGIEVVVCLRRVDFREEEAGLWTSVLRVDVSGHWETCLQDLLSIVQRSLKKLLEVLILWHLLVSSLPPLSNGLWRWQ